MSWRADTTSEMRKPEFDTTDRLLALFCAAGVGISFMEPRAFWLGAAICLLAAILTAGSHRVEFTTFLQKRRTKRRKPVKVPSGLYAALLLVCFCLASPVYFYITRSEPLLDTGILSRSWYERSIGYYFEAPPRFQIGPSGIFFSGPDGIGQLLLPIFTRDELRIEFFHGDIKVSSRISDETGKMVAEIKDNEWKVSPSIAWDKNYNNHSLEVKDAKGDVMLQVTVSPGVVHIQGYWWRDWGPPNGMMKIYVMQDQVTKEFKYVFSPSHPIDPIKIAPIFKYPSAQHLGELL